MYKSYLLTYLLYLLTYYIEPASRTVISKLTVVCWQGETSAEIYLEVSVTSRPAVNDQYLLTLGNVTTQGPHSHISNCFLCDIFICLTEAVHKT